MEPCFEDLSRGIRFPNASGHAMHYRYLSPGDDVEAITAVLHAAYAPLAAAGLRFVASYQDAETTRQRMAKGETIVVEDAGKIVGVVTLADAAMTGGSPFYDRPDVASFGQFAVQPSWQRFGIGSMLMSLVEKRATERGVAELALDTSERAEHLVAFYQKRGYRFIEYCQWEVTNYRSMVLAKSLTRSS